MKKIYQCQLCHKVLTTHAEGHLHWLKKQCLVKSVPQRQG